MENNGNVKRVIFSKPETFSQKYFFRKIITTKFLRVVSARTNNIIFNKHHFCIIILELKQYMLMLIIPLIGNHSTINFEYSF